MLRNHPRRIAKEDGKNKKRGQYPPKCQLISSEKTVKSGSEMDGSACSELSTFLEEKPVQGFANRVV
jgi:hypothetical protein